VKITHQSGDPKGLTLLEENARYMKHETFQRLVSNLREDGVLTQWPFVWNDVATGRRIVLSGNHRVQAAIEAGLGEIDWTECDEYLTASKRLGIQLSHNAIAGEDDPAVLKRLYESIEDVDERLYAGIDDATLDLLSRVDTTGLGEANLDYSTVMMVFLPEERERAMTALKEARAMIGMREAWLGRDDQHSRVLDSVEAARDAAHVMNAATAFDVLLDVWERHREDLVALWATPDGEPKDPKQWVPTSTVIGHAMPAEAAAVVLAAIRKMREDGDVNHGWQAMEYLSADYLQGN